MVVIVCHVPCACVCSRCALTVMCACVCRCVCVRVVFDLHCVDS